MHLPPATPGSTHHFVTYVKKWLRTKHAILFRLSNKLVQVAFSDKTEILLCGGDNVIK
jgi:polo-like kinase 1